MHECVWVYIIFQLTESTQSNCQKQPMAKPHFFLYKSFFSSVIFFLSLGFSPPQTHTFQDRINFTEVSLQNTGNCLKLTKPPRPVLSMNNYTNKVTNICLFSLTLYDFMDALRPSMNSNPSALNSLFNYESRFAFPEGNISACEAAKE